MAQRRPENDHLCIAISVYVLDTLHLVGIKRISITPNGLTTFPNGAPFTINSIVDPSILSQVYDTLNLEQYRVSRDDFFAGFSIRPFAPTEGEIAERFRQQLADRRLTFSERQIVETQVRSEIEQASRTAAELSFTVRNRTLPTEVGRSIVQMVPLVWSRNAIETKGVLRLPGFSASETVMKLEEIDNVPLPIAIVMVSEAGRRTSQRLQELLGTVGVATVRDPASGKSIRDIEREVADTDTFQANFLRSALSKYQFPEGLTQARSIVESRARDLELAEEGQTKSAAAIDNAISQFVQAAVGLSGRSTERRAPRVSETGDGGPLTIPQVGEGFLDRIIQMSRAGREGEQVFISELTRRQLDTTQRANATRMQRDLWRELANATQPNDAARAVLDEGAKATLIKTLRAFLANINEYWAASTRIEAQFAASRLDHTGKLLSSLRDSARHY